METEAEFHYFRAWLACLWAGEPERAPRGGSLRNVVRVQTRNMGKTARYLGIPVTALQDCASRTNWLKRAEAYDNYILARHAAGQLSTLEEARARQGRLLDNCHDIIACALEDVREGQRSDDLKTRLLAAKFDLPRLMDTMLHYENLLHGQATKAVKQEHTFAADWNLDALDEDDLMALARIREKVRVAG